jgi:hypothetical protein
MPQEEDGTNKIFTEFLLLGRFLGLQECTIINVGE